jgi:hypothetical protein
VNWRHAVANQSILEEWLTGSEYEDRGTGTRVNQGNGKIRGYLKYCIVYGFLLAVAPSTLHATRLFFGWSLQARAGRFDCGLLERVLVHFVGGIVARPGGNNCGGNHHADKCKGN